MIIDVHAGVVLGRGVSIRSAETINDSVIRPAMKLEHARIRGLGPCFTGTRSKARETEHAVVCSLSLKKKQEC